MARMLTPVGYRTLPRGEEDFAARRRKEHARPVRSPTKFLHEREGPQVTTMGNDRSVAQPSSRG
jgi:hypothetical protein